LFWLVLMLKLALVFVFVLILVFIFVFVLELFDLWSRMRRWSRNALKSSLKRMYLLSEGRCGHCSAIYLENEQDPIRKCDCILDWTSNNNSTWAEVKQNTMCSYYWNQYLDVEIRLTLLSIWWILSISFAETSYSKWRIFYV
jgi:hypothetical protein